MTKASKSLLKIAPVLLVVFVLIVFPAWYGYQKTNDEVYYDMGECLPEDMEYVIANSKLQDQFDIASTHMILVDASTPEKDVRAMCREMESVEGVKTVLGLETLVGEDVPLEILPDHLRQILESDRWKLLLIVSEYRAASDEVNEQITALNGILKKYDKGGMLIGEAPCMKDLIETTGHDFTVVNAISIALVFLIIFFVAKSVTLPILLISVIEVAIFINLGLPHYLGSALPFIAPIAISTIQLGATVDYAILMTTRYKNERIAGSDRKAAVLTALSTSIPSILVSGMGLFAATFGVAVYSNIDIVSSMCMLMARGALISMICVILAARADHEDRRVVDIREITSGKRVREIRAGADHSRAEFFCAEDFLELRGDHARSGITRVAGYTDRALKDIDIGNVRLLLTEVDDQLIICLVDRQVSRMCLAFDSQIFAWLIENDISFGFFCVKIICQNIEE